MESNLASAHCAQSAHRQEFVALAAKELGVAGKYSVLGRPMLKIAGWFKPMIAESYEMPLPKRLALSLRFTKFQREFGFAGTPYAAGIRTTAAFYRTAAHTKISNRDRQ